MPNIEGSPAEDMAKKAMQSYSDATRAYAQKQKAQSEAIQKAAQAVPAAGSTDWATREFDGIESQVAADMVPESVQKHQETIEAKRLPSAPYDAKTAAMLVPKEVDEYQARIEAPRVLPGRSMGEPIAQTPPEDKPDTPAAKQSRVAKLLAELKAEQTVKGKPNIADIIEAASAGWGGRKAAYVEKQEAEAERAAAAGELEKRAQLEEALQDERLAQELKIAQIKLGGIAPPTLAGLTPGQAAAAKFASQLGG